MLMAHMIIWCCIWKLAASSSQVAPPAPSCEGTDDAACEVDFERAAGISADELGVHLVQRRAREMNFQQPAAEPVNASAPAQQVPAPATAEGVFMTPEQLAAESAKIAARIVREMNLQQPAADPAAAASAPAQQASVPATAEGVFLSPQQLAAETAATIEAQKAEEAAEAEAGANATAAAMAPGNDSTVPAQQLPIEKITAQLQNIAKQLPGEGMATQLQKIAADLVDAAAANQTAAPIVGADGGAVAPQQLSEAPAPAADQTAGAIAAAEGVTTPGQQQAAAAPAMQLNDLPLQPVAIRTDYAEIAEKPTDCKTSVTKSTTNPAFPTPTVMDGKALPMNCSGHAKPLQVMRKRGGYSVRELNLDTGRYKKLFEIPFESVPGFFSEINACGINPKDGIIYCTMHTALTSYIVRISPGAVEFIAKLQSWMIYNTGGFNPGGRYFVANSTAHFLVLDDVKDLKGSNDRNDPALLDLSKAETYRPDGWKGASDVVTFVKDLTGNGEMEFIASMSGKYLQIAKWVPGDGFTKSWVVVTQQGGWDDTWGAGWQFNGRIFFAMNDGAGVFEVPLDDIWLFNPDVNATLELKKVGESEKTRSNDGMNCIWMPDPWITKVYPFDCDVNGGPIQSVQSAGGISVKKLQMETGYLADLYDIPWSKTTPPFRFLNGIGISPKDHIPYGALMLEKAPGNMYIVRFDWEKIEFVGKIIGKFNPIAGCFDAAGNYFFLSHPDEGKGTLYRIPGLHNIKGYESPLNTSLTDFSKFPGIMIDEMNQMADIVAIQYDIEGNGKFSDYIVGINRDQQVVVVEWQEDGESEEMDPEIPLKGQPCEQATVGWGGGCDRAIDANRNAHFLAGSCTSTQHYPRVKEPAWWKVKLPGRKLVEKVQVTNRGDCCPERLNGFSVLIDGQTCATIPEIGLGESMDIPCGKTGSELSIVLPGTGENNLALVEVRAWEPKGGPVVKTDIKSNVWRFYTNNVLDPYGAKLNFGAGWNFKGRLMWASNDGVGVFEAMSYNVSTGYVQLKEIGKSSTLKITDGFNCPSASPFWGNQTKIIQPTFGSFW